MSTLSSSSGGDNHNNKMMFIDDKSSNTLTTSSNEDYHFGNQQSVTKDDSSTTTNENDDKTVILVNTTSQLSSINVTMDDNNIQDLKDSDNIETKVSNINLNPSVLDKCSEMFTQPSTILSNISLSNNDNDSNSTLESNLEDLNEDTLTSAATTSITNQAENFNATINLIPSSNNSQEYHLKWIKWKGSTNKVPIVTQNSNGSCPLLAIINVLLLRKNFTFPPIIEIVTASQLMDYLYDCILTYEPKNLPEQVKLNYEQNLQDAMAIMPRLQTGLDVNIKFTGIMDFEYTPECIIFDLLRIHLCHGWLVDPEDKEVYRIVNNQSYNQLIDRIIASKAPTLNDCDMSFAEDFLKETASQLTNYGLSQLVKHIKDDELCILFRNNHFITMFKNKGKLYQLVTDQGFLTEPNVVWESLNNIEGDTYFVDGDFVLVPPKPSISLQPVPNINTQQQIDQDYLIALSLEQEQNYEIERNKSSIPDAKVKNNEFNQQEILISDEELARKLQAEENEYFEKVVKKQNYIDNLKQSRQLPASSNGLDLKNNWSTKSNDLSSIQENSNIKTQKLAATTALTGTQHHFHNHKASKLPASLMTSSSVSSSTTSQQSIDSSGANLIHRSSSHSNTVRNSEQTSTTPIQEHELENTVSSTSSRHRSNKSSCIIC